MLELQKSLFWLMKLWHACGFLCASGSLSLAKSLAKNSACCQCAAHYLFTGPSLNDSLFSTQTEIFSLLVLSRYLMGLNFSPGWCLQTVLQIFFLFSCLSICLYAVEYITSHKESRSSVLVEDCNSKSLN